MRIFSSESMGFSSTFRMTNFISFLSLRTVAEDGFTVTDLFLRSSAATRLDDADSR